MHNPIVYPIYILQLENYHLGRFFHAFFSRKTLANGEMRQEIKITKKLFAIITIAVALEAVAAYVLTTILPLYVAIICIAVMLIFFFIFLVAATILLMPFDSAVKSVIIWRARQKLRGFRNLTIIGITGSFGKTTMKEILSTVLGEKFRVFKTPENINTPVGIARLIQNKLPLDTEIFIVEMGAYHRGDIAALCRLTPPDISILTGINESHLERFGSMENTVAAKFEIVDHASRSGTVVLNMDSRLVAKNYAHHVATRRVITYTSEGSEANFLEDGSGFELDGIRIPLLGEYAVGMVRAARALGELLGMSESQINSGISHIKPAPHRLERIHTANDIVVIDDSYNGNPDGARAAISTLNRFKNRRKIYITPGLVEMGDKTREIHYDIGARLRAVADLVILIRNSVTPEIERGLIEKGFDPSNIVWFDSASEAHSAIGKISRAGDVLLFQNDWPDNYS
ncbi:MAG: UDP-N-acetylmuramoyl-tripeptide--D-alanyl-D-alanine ligase [Patescibacteria group bacterium]